MFYENMKDLSPLDFATNEILKILDIVWLTINMWLSKWETMYKILDKENWAQEIIFDNSLIELIKSLFSSIDKSQIITLQIVKIIYFDLLKNWWISNIVSDNLIINWVDFNPHVQSLLVENWMKVLNNKHWFTTSWALIKTLKSIVS